MVRCDPILFIASLLFPFQKIREKSMVVKNPRESYSFSSFNNALVDTASTVKSKFFSG
jgi:hypothetical protein